MGNGVTPPRYEHAVGFGEHATLVADIHRDVLTPHDIKAPVFERQIGDTALADGDSVVKRAKPIQVHCRLNIFWGKIDRLNLAAVGLREITARTAHTASRIEDPHVLRKANQFGLGFR